MTLAEVLGCCWTLGLSPGVWLERGTQQGEGPETRRGAEPAGRSDLVHPEGGREAAPRRRPEPRGRLLAKARWVAGGLCGR